jgi:outer membrane receptor protein involved in Fe transport
MKRLPLALSLMAAAARALAAAPDAGPPGPSDTPVTRVQVIGVLPFPAAEVDRDTLPYTVQTLERDALGGSQSERLTDALARRFNGVTVNDIAGSPFQADVSYRGQRASPILGAAQGMSVYLDGVRVNEPFGDVVNWDMLPEAAIARVNLVSGSNPLYGLNALGGALALQTRSGLDESGFEAELSGGMAGRRRADLSWGGRTADGWHGFAASTLFAERGWRAASNGRLGNLFLKGGHAGSNANWSVSLLLAHSRLIGNGLLPSWSEDDGVRSSSLYEQDRRAVYTYPDTTVNHLRQAAFQLEQRVGRGFKLAAGAYLRASRRSTVGGDVNDDYADAVDACGADTDACRGDAEGGAALHPASLNTTATHQVGRGAHLVLHGARAAHRFDLGLSIDHSRVEFAQFEQDAWFTPQREAIVDPQAASTPGSSVTGSQRTLGAYAFDAWALDTDTSVTASARMNLAHVGNTLATEEGPQAPEAFTYRHFNPALGVTHRSGALTWYANAAQANRVPTVIELGCADPAQPCRLPAGLQSDPYLKQVVARSVEAGLRADWGSVEASAGIYRSVNRDDILFISSGVSRAGYFANFDRTLRQGAELGASGRAASLRWRVAYSYLDAVYDADGALFTGTRTVQVRSGTRIAGLPRHTFKLGLDWEAAPRLTLGADLQAQSSLATQGNEDGAIDDEGTRADWSVRGFALLNLHASWRPAPGWELFARASNVLDRRYETYGLVAPDLFPGGTLLRPQAGAGSVTPSRFVAPGAPLLLTAGLRYRF